MRVDRPNAPRHLVLVARHHDGQLIVGETQHPRGERLTMLASPDVDTGVNPLAGLLGGPIALVVDPTGQLGQHHLTTPQTSPTDSSHIPTANVSADAAALLDPPSTIHTGMTTRPRRGRRGGGDDDEPLPDFPPDDDELNRLATKLDDQSRDDTIGLDPREYRVLTQITEGHVGVPEHLKLRFAALGVQGPRHHASVSGRANAVAGPSQPRRTKPPTEHIDPSDAQRPDALASDTETDPVVPSEDVDTPPPAPKGRGKGKLPAVPGAHQATRASLSAGTPITHAAGSSVAHAVDTDERSQFGHHTSGVGDLLGRLDLSGVSGRGASKGITHQGKRARDEVDARAAVPHRPRKRPKSTPTTDDPSSLGAPKGTAKMTAAELETMLREMIATGDSARSVAMGHGFSDSNWLAPSGWKGNSRHASQLSSMEDYPQHRDNIQTLLRRLPGLENLELPEPQAPKWAFTAEDLLGALHLLIDLRRRPETAAKVNLGQFLAKKTGVSRSTIMTWIRADGAPPQGMASLGQLPGYDEHREEVKAAYEKLGHGDRARETPERGGATIRKRMTAEILAKALNILAEHPDTPLTSVAQNVGFSHSSLRKYVGARNGGLRVEFSELAKLPDYSEWREPIGDAA